MADEIIIETTSAEVIEVGVPGPQGPAGAAGTGLETLTTQGDTLYRGASTGERLPIGSAGQVLKVVNGVPAWANESGAVTSVNGATGAVTVAAAQHAVEHEAGEADEIQAMAALVETDYLPLNGVYFWDGTTTSGRPNFFKTGTRKNTNIVYNSATGEWNLVRNNVVESIGVDGSVSVPWDTTWGDFVTATTVTVTRLGLEDMVQKLAENGSAATATTSEDGLMSSSDKTKLNGIASGATAVTASNATPSALGTAAAGTSANYARADHVHALPNASALLSTGAGAGDLPVAQGDGTVAWQSGSTWAGENIGPADISAADAIHAATHAAAGSDPVFDQNLNTTDVVTFNEVNLTNLIFTGAGSISNSDQDASVTLNAGSVRLGGSIIETYGNLAVLDVSNGNSVKSATFDAQSNLTANRTYDLPDASGVLALTADIPSTFAASAITSGTLAHERGGLEADVSAYSGLLKISGGATSAVTVTTAGEALLDDADAAAQRTTLGLGGAATLSVGTTTGTVAAGDDSRITGAAQKSANLSDLASVSTARTNLGLAAIAASGSASDLGSGTVPIARLGASGTPSGSTYLAGDNTWKAAGGVTSGSVDNAVLRADGVSGSQSQSSDINIDDATTATQNNVAITNQHSGQTNSALVLTPKGTGAFIVGPKPDGVAAVGGNARGTRAINISLARTAATQVASGTDSIAIGSNSTSSGTNTIAIGTGANNTSSSGGIVIGTGSTNQNTSIVIGGSAQANSGADATAICRDANASGQSSISFGPFSAASAVGSVALGWSTSASLRTQFSTLSFSAVYWGGQTTDGTANVELNLDATATNRMTIAANTAVLADIYVVARQTDNTRFLAARRWAAIRRDGSNNTSLIGAVQTLGTDQSEGSPTWTFTIDADDTASVESLRVRVTGAASQTVNWRVMALYRVVA